MSKNNNLAKVVFSLETYERRVATAQAELELKQQQTIAKMQELGFSEEEIESLTSEA